MNEKKVASLKIVFEDGSDYSVACEKGLDKDELAKYIERAFKPTPAEPLIKDEKIRKAVRAWAEVNVLDNVVYDSAWNAFRKYDFTICFDYFFDEHDGLTDEAKYTITELCGEEEE